MKLIFILIVMKQTNRCLLNASYSWSVTVRVEHHPVRYCPLKGANSPV